MSEIYARRIRPGRFAEARISFEEHAQNGSRPRRPGRVFLRCMAARDSALCAVEGIDEMFKAAALPPREHRPRPLCWRAMGRRAAIFNDVNTHPRWIQR